ncbi:ribosome assembly factor SBDS [Candidatus Woesearchaeota archaeon]|nr:ribosome assembly factor SBDS [Candidatus Woesearchaeota archaeon]
MDKQQLYDREKLHINLAKLKVKNQEFEVVVDPDLAIEFRKGNEDIDILAILNVEDIFSDAKKGLRPNEKALAEVFGTDDKIKIAEEIIKKGEIQLSSNYREKERETKKRRILEIIQINSINPRDKTPIPLTRLKNAWDEANIHINDYKTAEEQVNDVLEKFKPLIPIRFSRQRIKINVPGQYAVKIYGEIKKNSTVENESWNNDGSWTGTVIIPGGLQEKFIDNMKNKTHGNIKIELLND